MTQHQQRQQQIRERLNRVVKHLDRPENRSGPTDGFTTFADEMVRIAREHNRVPWKVSNINKAGTPKDLPTTLRRFASGRSGVFSGVADVIELTCIEYEARQREARAAARAAEAEQASKMVLAEPEEAAQSATEERVDFTVAAFIDPEIVAVAEVYAALKKLPTDKTRNRVAHYALDRCANEELGNGA